MLLRRRAIDRRSLLRVLGTYGLKPLQRQGLVFGSGAVFRVVNAILAVEFTTAAIHDLWHLLTDALVGLAVGSFHWRILRVDRTSASPALVPPPIVLVLPTPIEGMRQRLVTRFGNEGGRVFETDAEGVRDGLRRMGPADDAPATRGTLTPDH
ncbi:MAG TPA: hypothetical protein VGA16_03385 [Candidatus Limnocylindria bacterium]